MHKCQGYDSESERELRFRDLDKIVAIVNGLDWEDLSESDPPGGRKRGGERGYNGEEVNT